MVFHAYILRCADGSYYVGQTDTLEHRIAHHQSGQVEGYTHKRRPVVLVWSQDFLSRLEALTAERRIKGWSRAKKEALIAGNWGRISRLARNRQDQACASTGSARTELEAASTSRTSTTSSLPARPEPVEGSVLREKRS